MVSNRTSSRDYLSCTITLSRYAHRELTYGEVHYDRSLILNCFYEEKHPAIAADLKLVTPPAKSAQAEVDFFQPYMIWQIISDSSEYAAALLRLLEATFYQQPQLLGMR